MFGGMPTQRLQGVLGERPHRSKYAAVVQLTALFWRASSYLVKY